MDKEAQYKYQYIGSSTRKIDLELEASIPAIDTLMQKDKDASALKNRNPKVNRLESIYGNEQDEKGESDQELEDEEEEKQQNGEEGIDDEEFDEEDYDDDVTDEEDEMGNRRKPTKKKQKKQPARKSNAKMPSLQKHNSNFGLFTK